MSACGGYIVSSSLSPTLLYLLLPLSLSGDGESCYLWYIRNGKSLGAILPINELSILQVNKDANDVYNNT